MSTASSCGCGASSRIQTFLRVGVSGGALLHGLALGLALTVHSGISAESGHWTTIVSQAQTQGGFQWSVIPSHSGSNLLSHSIDSLPPTPLFRAWASVQWPPGLVPIFLVEKDDQEELRRKPLKGQENFSNPLFFALPRSEESDTMHWAGRWNLVATNATGTTHHVAMEWTLEDGHIVGRLDQNTDYRFAFLHDGLCQSNRVEIKIDYINDHYVLTGERQGSKLMGRWVQTDQSDGGHWVAERPSPGTEKMILEGEKAVPLYEWRRRTDGRRWYGVEKPAFQDAHLWAREPIPLCRVWRVESAPPNTSPRVKDTN